MGFLFSFWVIGGKNIFEKVNPFHPDNVADRIGGCFVMVIVM